MLEKIEILESFHDKEQSVILRDAMLCISLCLWIYKFGKPRTPVTSEMLGK